MGASFKAYSHDDHLADDGTNKKYKNPRELDWNKDDGIKKNRHCTDVFCLLLIVITWIVMTYMGYIGIKKGDPYRLISAVNDQGDICGYTGSGRGKPYFYTVMTNSFGVCVEECPSVDASSLSSTDVNDYYCLYSVHYLYSSDSTLSTYISTSCMTDGVYDISTDCGCNIQRATTSMFHRCIFDDPDVRNQYISQSTDYASEFIGDIAVSRAVIFGFGTLFAVVLSFFWSFILRFRWIGYLVAWSAIIVMLGMMSMVAYYADKTAQQWADASPPEHTNDEIKALRWFSYVILVITFILACVIIKMRKAVNLSIKVMSLAAGAIQEMPVMVLVPLFQLFFFCLFLFPWFIYAVYIASDGSYVQKDTADYGYNLPTDITFTVFEPAPTVEGRAWFFLFILLWTMNFISMLGSLVISLAVVSYYFTRPSERVEKINNDNVFKSYYYAIRYHMGTVAVGAFIIAVVQIVRAYVSYVQRKCKKYADNALVKFIFCIVQCHLYCLEKILKFISKNAYIQTAIHGTPFFKSCKIAFFLIARNIMRIGTVAVASSAALFVGKVFVCIACGGATYFILNAQYADKVHGFVIPVMLTMGLAWVTCTVFMDVFHMTIDTILMCVITDEEIHDGTALFSDDETLAFIKEYGVSEKDSKKHRKMLEKAGRALPAATESGAPAKEDSAVDGGEIELHENKTDL